MEQSREFGWAELDSAVDIQEVRVGHRRDPYFDGLFSRSSAASWLESDVAEAHVAAGGRPPPHWVRGRTTHDDLSWVESTELRTKTLPLLGVAHAHRAVSCDQMAAFVGRPELMSGRDPAAARLWSNGLVDIGAPPQTGTFGDRHGTLYRPAARQGAHRFEEMLEPELTLAERVAVLGGGEFNGAHAADRHNVLAAELLLRVAEFADVAAVVGDGFCALDQIVDDPPSTRWYPERKVGTQLVKPRVSERLHPDGIIVLTDGRMVALEVTASASPTLHRKVEAWARLFTIAPEINLEVVFVAAERRDLVGKRGPTSVESAVRKTVKRTYIRGQELANLSRVHVVGWEKWFPRPDIATRAFLDLEVDTFRRDPTGENGSFHPLKLALDRGRTGFEQHAELVRSNAAALFQTPYWLRRDMSTPALWQLPLDLAGQDPAVHVEAVDGAPRRGAAVGAAGVPRRLRALGGVGWHNERPARAPHGSPKPCP